MARQFDFKKVAFIRTKLCSLLHTAGDERIAKTVRAVATGGRARAATAMNAYEQIIGISEVKAAQENVTKIEQEFLEARQTVAEAGKQVGGLQDELHTLRGKLDRTPRDDPKFLELATEEHRMLQAETRLKEWFTSVETKERDTFTQLSMAVRESHEKHRAHEERTKYWSIIGSICGTLVGIVGSGVANHRRMRELRTLVSDLSKGGIGTDDSRRELSAVVQQLSESLGRGDAVTGHQNLENTLNDATRKQEELLSQQLQAIERLLNEKNSKLAEQMKGMRRSSDIGAVGDAGSIEELLSDAEQKLEWEMKMSTLSTVVFIYGAFALTLPILYSIFK